MSGRTLWRSAWLPLGCWLVVVFGLSSVPNLSPPDVGLPLVDKLAHCGEYGILGALFARARTAGGSRTRVLLLGALLGLGVGTLDELYQSGTPGRDTSALDAAADVAGAALGALAWKLAAERRARRAAPSGR